MAKTYQVREVVTWGQRHGAVVWTCPHRHKSLGDARRCALTRGGVMPTNETVDIEVVNHGTDRVRQRYRVVQRRVKTDEGVGWQAKVAELDRSGKPKE